MNNNLEGGLDTNRCPGNEPTFLLWGGQRESGRNRAKVEGCSQKALKEILAADSQATAIPRFSSALLKWSWRDLVKIWPAKTAVSPCSSTLGRSRFPPDETAVFTGKLKSGLKDKTILHHRNKNNHYCRSQLTAIKVDSFCKTIFLGIS